MLIFWILIFIYLFSLYSIKFEFSLEAYARGDRNNVIFNAAIDLLIFGKRYYLATEFNLRDPVGSLRSGSDKATEWYKSNMNNEQATAPESNFYDSPNPYADFEMSGIKQQLKMNRGILNRWIAASCTTRVRFPNDFVCILNGWYRAWGKTEFPRTWTGARSWISLFLGPRLYIVTPLACRESKCVVTKR